MRVSIAQINPTVGDLKGNENKITEYIKSAELKKADVIILPELAVCGYPPEDLLYKEYFVQENINIVKKIAQNIRDYIVILGFVDKDNQGNLYNAAAIITEGRIKNIYHKEELPNYGVFDEKRYFVSESGANNKLLLINGILIGVNICEDIWQDAGAYKNQAQQGAKVLVNLSSSPYVIGKIKQRERLLIKRAKETHCYICYANLIGGQDELVFDGSSRIVNPSGEIIAKGKSFEEDIIFADFHLQNRTKKVKNIKKTVSLNVDCKQYPQILHIQKGARQSYMEKMYKALVLGTKDYIKKNGFHKVVIGLSGGIDSSLVAVIAVDAIGEKNVIGVTMPSQYTSTETREDVTKLTESLKVKLIEIPINAIYSSYANALKESFFGTKQNVAEENIQARIRGNLLMALSNKYGWLVLTTGNKSEVAVGYCTLYGDMSGGFAVIKDIPKTKVYTLANFINKKTKLMIPESIIKREPSAELKMNQKDQDSLPPYEVLDNMLEIYVEKHKSLIHNKNFSNVLAQKVVSLVDNSEYKRRQAPPGIKITERAFGKDWRLPITNKYQET